MYISYGIILLIRLVHFRLVYLICYVIYICVMFVYGVVLPVQSIDAQYNTL